MYHMTSCFLFITTGNVIFCQFIAPSAPFLKYTCETDKEPINPTGFPALFAPMIIYCCICTGIHITYLYVCAVYYAMFDGKSQRYFESWIVYDIQWQLLFVYTVIRK